jgi:hypothetical protein
MAISSSSAEGNLRLALPVRVRERARFEPPEPGDEVLRRVMPVVVDAYWARKRRVIDRDLARLVQAHEAS